MKYFRITETGIEIITALALAKALEVSFDHETGIIDYGRPEVRDMYKQIPSDGCRLPLDSVVGS